MQEALQGDTRVGVVFAMFRKGGAGTLEYFVSKIDHGTRATLRGQRACHRTEWRWSCFQGVVVERKVVATPARPRIAK